MKKNRSVRDLAEGCGSPLKDLKKDVGGAANSNKIENISFVLNESSALQNELAKLNRSLHLLSEGLGSKSVISQFQRDLSQFNAQGYLFNNDVNFKNFGYIFQPQHNDFVNFKHTFEEIFRPIKISERFRSLIESVNVSFKSNSYFKKIDYSTTRLQNFFENADDSWKQYIECVGVKNYLLTVKNIREKFSLDFAEEGENEEENKTPLEIEHELLSMTDDLSSATVSQFHAAYAIALESVFHSEDGSVKFNKFFYDLPNHVKVFICIVAVFIIDSVSGHVVGKSIDFITDNLHINDACVYSSSQENIGNPCYTGIIIKTGGCRVFSDPSYDSPPVYKFDYNEPIVLESDKTPDGTWRKVAYAFDKKTNTPIKFGWVKTDSFERMRNPTPLFFGIYSEKYDD